MAHASPGRRVLQRRRDPDPDQAVRRKGRGLPIGSHTNSVTLDMTGTHMASGTQAIGTGSDEALDVPADVSGQRWLEMKSRWRPRAEITSNSDRHGWQFCRRRVCPFAGRRTVLWIFASPAEPRIYAKANTGAVNIDWRTVQV